MLEAIPLIRVETRRIGCSHTLIQIHFHGRIHREISIDPIDYVSKASMYIVLPVKSPYYWGKVSTNKFINIQSCLRFLESDEGCNSLRNWIVPKERYINNTGIFEHEVCIGNVLHYEVGEKASSTFQRKFNMIYERNFVRGGLTASIVYTLGPFNAT